MTDDATAAGALLAIGGPHATAGAAAGPETRDVDVLPRETA